MKRLLFLLSLLCPLLLEAQHATEVAPLKGERWWGGMVALGSEMPFAAITLIGWQVCVGRTPIPIPVQK